MRILVVEDEGLIVEELRERLSRAGMQVVAAADSAHAAVASAVEHRPDLVLMDIRIKGPRDGVEAARDIEARLDVPVVFLTAHSDRGTLDRAKAVAPFGYVLKPFDQPALLVAIELAMHRHALERRLRESERRYVATLASIGDGVIATDLQGCVTYSNYVAEALTGWPFSEARGLPVDDIFRVARDAGGDHPLAPFREAIRTQSTLRFSAPDFFLLSRNGDAIAIDDSVAPIVDASGRVLGAVAAFRDMRSRRLAEDALRRAQDELAQARKMESVGRLAAGIAHDFNNLLTVINGCAGLVLESERLDPQIRDLLTQVAAAGDRAASLTRQLLAYGRKQPRQPAVVDVSALVVTLAPMLERLIGETVRLTVEPSPVPSPVMADASQLEQVVVNLAVNARDAMPKGGTLTIGVSDARIATPDHDAAEPPVPPGRYVVLAVADTGSGIDPAIRDRVFEPYFTTKDVGQGSGLGLATVYGIVKQSSGFVEVESAPEQGTHVQGLSAVVRAAVRGRRPREERDPRRARKGDHPAGRGRGVRPDAAGGGAARAGV